MWMTWVSNWSSFKVAAPGRCVDGHALAVADDQRGVRPPGLLLQPRLGLLQRGAPLLADPQPLYEVEDGRSADHWVRRYVRSGAQKLDWLVVEETQLDMALWADLVCVGLNADVKLLLLGDFRQLPAVLDS